MSTRKKVWMTDSPMEMIVTMSEGNPGAMSVLMKLFSSEPHGFIFGLHLDDMNIRGPQIWLGFKDFAGEDLEKFKQALKDRSKEMVDLINKEYLLSGEKEMAVTSGASFSR